MGAPFPEVLDAWRCNRPTKGLGALVVRSNPLTHTYPARHIALQLGQSIQVLVRSIRDLSGCILHVVVQCTFLSFEMAGMQRMNSRNIPRQKHAWISSTVIPVHENQQEVALESPKFEKLQASNREHLQAKVLLMWVLGRCKNRTVVQHIDVW